ncbi:MAG: hypothetical protein J6A75_04290 [Lachnospiraceae bacterium]|nr:hypothetical protein [Lachnospiraceae bacterium]
MKSRVNDYKNAMINIFEIKYGILEFEARKWIREYDFNGVLKSCNYMALHDDPEIWVDAIYQWINGEEDLLEM